MLILISTNTIKAITGFVAKVASHLRTSSMDRIRVQLIVGKKLSILPMWFQWVILFALPMTFTASYHALARPVYGVNSWVIVMLALTIVDS